jgi:AcrR family transcriptional regulator
MNALNTAAHEPVLTAKKVGLRERSKRERQDRIIMAARNMFAEYGYDATTLRQVAERAGLGLGTLFNYISDKRDLIYLVFNREVSVACDAALLAPRPWQSFTEKILSMVEPNYRLFGSEPVLSRILLSEILQHTPGLHLAEHTAIRDRFIRGIEEVVTEAQQSGEIASTENPKLIARHIFFSYSAALRWWLSASEAPEWRCGLREFAEILKLQTTGLNLRSNSKSAGQPLTRVSSSAARSRTTRPAMSGSLATRTPKTKRARALQKA